MHQDFDYITVNKVWPREPDVICLLTYENEGDPFGRPSSIKKITINDRASHQETLLTTNTTLTDLTVSSFGTIWAVDILGHLHCSKPGLNSESADKELIIQSYSLNWSFEVITGGTPVCVIGQDDDLWIATHEGELIHYDGKQFVTTAGMTHPIKMKEVNGSYFLMGYQGQLMQCVAGRWQTLELDASVPAWVSINDLTAVDGRLLAVSNAGLILSQKDDGAFTVLVSTPDIPWFGCDELQGTVYLAGGAHGAFKLALDTVQPIKEKGYMVATSAIGDEVMFLLANTVDAGFVRHTPLDDGRWVMVKT